MSKLENKTDYASQLYKHHLRGGKTNFKNNSSDEQKAMLYGFYHRILSELCMNRFIWEGLPDTIDVRFLESTLLMHGLAVFYFDDEYNRYLALRGSGMGVNMYDNPTQFIVQGNTMLNKILEPDECVPIWANYTRSSDIDIIDIYASRLAEIDRTNEINQMAQRHPFILTGNINQKLSLTNLYRKVQDGEPVIIGTDELRNVAQDSISLLDLHLPSGVMIENLDVKTRTWNEALTLLGIMNVNNTKKERLVEDEANSASGHVLGMRAIHMNSREEAVKLINDRYGLNVSVSWGLDESNDSLGYVNLGSLL